MILWCHSREQKTNQDGVANIVDAKNSLDNSVGGDSCPNQFVKPPANLVVLEGDCLDTSGDGGELESYLVIACSSTSQIIGNE